MEDQETFMLVSSRGGGRCVCRGYGYHRCERTAALGGAAAGPDRPSMTSVTGVTTPAGVTRRDSARAPPPPAVVAGGAWRKHHAPRWPSVHPPLGVQMRDRWAGRREETTAPARSLLHIAGGGYGPACARPTTTHAPSAPDGPRPKTQPPHAAAACRGWQLPPPTGPPLPSPSSTSCALPANPYPPPGSRHTRTAPSSPADASTRPSTGCHATLLTSPAWAGAATPTSTNALASLAAPSAAGGDASPPSTGGGAPPSPPAAAALCPSAGGSSLAAGAAPAPAPGGGSGGGVSASGSDVQPSALEGSGGTPPGGPKTRTQSSPQAVAMHPPRPQLTS